MILAPTALSTSGSGVTSAIAAITIILLYGFASRFGPLATQTTEPNARKIAILFGLIIGAIFLIQIVSEYLFPVTGQIDELWGYVAFGGLPLWYLLAGTFGTYTTHSLRAGVLAAMWSAMIGSLIWINVLLLVYYLFLHTSQESRVLLADNTIADFKQSGMQDLSAFVIQDYLGACFFHLLLSPLLAALAGVLGGLLGKRVVRLQARPVESLGQDQ